MIAAAGFHNLLMMGPPGVGKSMIAGRIPGILPPLTLEESLEVTSIYSVAGLLTPEQALITERPFYAPHHTVTAAALIGGGNAIPDPEWYLWHIGVCCFWTSFLNFSGRCWTVCGNRWKNAGYRLPGRREW